MPRGRWNVSPSWSYIVAVKQSMVSVIIRMYKSYCNIVAKTASIVLFEFLQEAAEPTKPEDTAPEQKVCECVYD